MQKLKTEIRWRADDCRKNFATGPGGFLQTFPAFCGIAEGPRRSARFGKAIAAFGNLRRGGDLQEADESQLCLELLREECGGESVLTKPIDDEASELIAIFITMIHHHDQAHE